MEFKIDVIVGLDESTMNIMQGIASSLAAITAGQVTASGISEQIQRIAGEQITELDIVQEEKKEVNTSTVDRIKAEVAAELEAKPEPEAVKLPNYDEIHSLSARLVKAGKSPGIKAILKEMRVERLPDMKKEQYIEFKTRLEAL